MVSKSHSNQGLKKLVKHCHEAFQLAENTEYYNEDDYQTAERKFVKYCLFNKTGQNAF